MLARPEEGVQEHSRRSLIPVVAAATLLHLADQFRLNLPTTHTLHHSKVFEIVMRLEERISSEELD